MASRSLSTPLSRRALMRTAASAGVGIIGLDILAACGTSSGAAGNVTITTNELPASSNPAQVKIYQNYVKAFEQLNPGVTINGLADPYSTQTYFTKAAAHCQEDLVDAPFTDPQLMIARGTVADVTSQANQQ